MKKIKPYGDTLNDGKVQVSFTLPISYGIKGDEAAKNLATKMGIMDPIIATSSALSDDFSFYIIYGTSIHEVNLDEIKIEEQVENIMSKDEIESFIETNFNKPIVFVGASTGTDAHTVGIDAIMNMKGYAGHFGLERYKGITAINLGGQVDNETLLQEALKYNADVILISQTVTQKDVHVQNLTKFIELLEAENLRDRFIVIIGGPRITPTLAKELGFDAGFGPQKYAYDVASFACQALVKTKT